MYRYDIHVHARPSRNGVSAWQNFVNTAIARGMDGICFTEHSHTEKFDHRPKSLKHPDTFTVMWGQEVSTPSGDVLVYGADTSIPKGTSIDDMPTEWALVKAHPWRGRGNDGKLCPGYDAVEIFNGGRTNADTAKVQDDILWTGLSTTGGSDAHRHKSVGKCFTCVTRRIACIEGLIEAIKLRKTIGGYR